MTRNYLSGKSDPLLRDRQCHDGGILTNDSLKKNAKKNKENPS